MDRTDSWQDRAKELLEADPSLGYGKLHAMLQEEGFQAGKKKVQQFVQDMRQSTSGSPAEKPKLWQKILAQKRAAPPPAAGVPEGVTCRICLDDTTGEGLVSPCRGCRGSAAYVHYSCILQYYISKADWNNPVCPTCQTMYEGQSAVNLCCVGLNTVRKKNGPMTQEFVQMLHLLSVSYDSMGDYETLRGLTEEAIAIQEELESGVDVRLIGNAASAAGKLGDTATQKELLERVTSIKTEKLGDDHPSVALSKMSMGINLCRSGDPSSAKKLFEEALEIQERVLPRDNASIAFTLVNLAKAIGMLGDPNKAIELLERALEIRLRQYGAKHREVGVVYGSLAIQHQRLGNGTKARDYGLKCLEIEEEAYGPNHQELVATLVNLSNAYSMTGERAKREDTVKRLAGLDPKMALRLGAMDAAQGGYSSLPLGFSLGESVVVHGLSGAKELNGLRGVIKSWIPAKSRFEIKLEGRDETKAIRPENLLQPGACNSAMFGISTPTAK